VNRRWLIWVVIALAAAVAVIAGARWAARGVQPDDPDAVEIKLHVDGALDRAHLIRNRDGALTYVLQSYDGTMVALTPDELAAQLYTHGRERSRNVLAMVFNISSPVGIAWVSLGLLGQLLFTGRMLVQWLASERHKRSVVPAAFWWMSMVGAMMLLTYFVWRRDIVGVLGQSFGLIVYIRNIHLIYGVRAGAATRVASASVHE
jgi:lipid-A-disaccharide synthase-like uncharacterized protein